MKKIISILLAVTMTLSTLCSGVSVVSADEDHTSEIITDPTEDTTETTSETEEETTEVVTEPTETTTEEPTEPTEELPEVPKAPTEGDTIVGDYNNDGTVSILDATEIQKSIAFDSFSENAAYGDVDGNGTISILDATQIQKLLVLGNNITEIQTKQGIYSPEMGTVKNLISKGYTETEINLSWEPMENALGYEVFAYSYQSGYKKIGDASQNSFVLKTEAATGYSVAVRAWSEQDGKTYISDFSNMVNVASAPNKGTLKGISRLGNGNFVVSADIDKQGNILNNQGEIIGTFINGKATVDESYDGQEAAIENRFLYGNVATSSFTDKFVLEGDIPAINGDISVDGTHVTINWDKIEGADGYEIFKLNSDGEYISIADTTDKSYSETVNYGSKNTYSVRCYAIKDGEKKYYSETTLEAITAPKAQEQLSLWVGDTITPEIDCELVYTLESSNPDIVQVNGNEITALSSGTAQIKVLGEWAEEIVINVTVRKAPSTLTLNNYNLILLVNEESTLKATIDEGAESEITFTSSDTSKATVDKNGLIKALKPGTVVITAETENGVKAECKVEIYAVDSRSFVTSTSLMSNAAWDSDVITSVSNGSKAYVLETKGTWIKVRYGSNIGWVYNKSFDTSIKNYSTIDTNTLPIIIDDWIFDNGRDIRTIYNYVTRKISYRNLRDDTVENLCVHVLRYGTGACYHYGAMLYYMLDRAGYDTLIVDGIDDYTGGGPHRWNMVKVNGNWYHIDATPIIGLPEYYLVTDSVIEQVFSWDRDKYPATP